jgi:hypothetical protein
MAGNSYLAQQRAPMFAELQQKPWLLNMLASIGESENSGKPLAVLESLFNRAAMTGKPLEQLARSGFYGARTRQRLQADMQSNGPSTKVLDNTQAALDQIKQGSNVTQGATDQGMENEIKSPFKINVDGEYYGDMDNGAFRAKQQAAANAAGPATGTQVAANAPATAPAPAPLSSSPSSTAARPAPTDVPRTGVGGLGAGSQGRGGIDIPAAPGANPQLANVAPVLRELLGGAKAEFEARNPGYQVAATSGARPGGPSSSQHAAGNAIDMQIISPDGKAVPNTGNDPSGLYHQYARLVYAEQQANHPELNGKLAWGGAFGTQLGGGGPPDLMHFDLGGERGHWTMNRPSQLGALPLTGAAAMANTQNGSQTQAPAYGPPTPPGSIVQGGGLYNPAGGQPGQVPQRMGAKGGGMYIPVVSDILGAFTGSMGRKGGGMYATQAGAAQGVTPDRSGQYGLPGGTTTQPGTIPAGPPQRWNPATKSWDTGVGPGTPSTMTPATGDTGPNKITPLSVTDYLHPELSTTPPVAPTPGPAPGPYTTIPGTAGQVPTQAGTPALMPGQVGPPGGGPSAVQQMMGLGARPLPTPPAPTPSQVVAQRFPQTVAPPVPNAPTAAPAGAPRGYSAATGGPNAPSPYGPGGPYANPYNPGGVGAPAGLAARGIPSPAGMLNAINPVSSAAAAPQPPGANVPIPRPNPIAGTQTALSIPPRGPWPPRPPGAPNPSPGDTTTVAGIPLPRPRPGMPANPPAQIPQPQGPTPQQAPAPAAPSSASSALLPQAGSFAERFAGAPGGPGTGQFQNPALAAALAQAAIARAPQGTPQGTPQGGPVAAGPGPGQPMTAAQWFADKNARGMATGDWDPALEQRGPGGYVPGDVKQDAIYPVGSDQFYLRGLGAASYLLAPMLGTGRGLGVDVGTTNITHLPQELLPPGGPPASFADRFGAAPGAGQYQNPALAAALAQRGAPGASPINVFPQQAGPAAAAADTSGMDAATLEYLRRQMQQQMQQQQPQGDNPGAGAY